VISLSGITRRPSRSVVLPMGVAVLGGQIQARSGGSMNCQLAPGNPALTIPDTQEDRDADLDGDGQICWVEIVS